MCEVQTSNLSYQMPKTVSSNKGADKWREILFVSRSFLVHIIWVKEREGDNSFIVVRRGNTTKTDVLKVPIDSHIEVELTPLFNDDDLRYVISKQLGGNGRKFKQVMVPADCSDSIEMVIPLGMGNLAASLDPEQKVLRETVLEHFISTGGLDKYVNPDELLDSAIDDLSLIHI